MDDDDIIMSYLEEANAQGANAAPASAIENEPIQSDNNNHSHLLQKAAHISSTLKTLSTSPLPQSATRLLVLSLRQVNRLIHGQVLEQRRSLSGLRGAIDELNAKLISSRFEKQHLLAQAQKCLTFK